MENGLTTEDELQGRAENLILELLLLNSVPGGGTLPDVKIPSFGIEIDHDISKELKEQQRICQLLQESKTEDSS